MGGEGDVEEEHGHFGERVAGATEDDRDVSELLLYVS